MGRRAGPEKVTVDVVNEKRDQILELIGRGASPELVAAAFGVHDRTWRDWRRRARDGHEPYASLFDDFLRARAMHLVMTQIGMVESGQLLPAAWILERSRPDLFGMRPELRIDSADDDQASIEQQDQARIEDLATRYRSALALTGPAEDTEDEDGG